jgi:hypothetical protein
MRTVTLFRPVGQKELDLIAATGYKEFPPRLDWQPIFYPVVTQDYAEFIAREWNTKDVENGCVGFVTRFRLNASFIEAYETHEVGGRDFTEYWITSEDLAELNSHIDGLIDVISEFRAEDRLVSLPE